MNCVEALDAELAVLAGAGLRRAQRTVTLHKGAEYAVDGRRVINFCSNDYLGLADAPELTAAAIAGAQRWGVGSGASHLISGHSAAHAAAEARLAAYVGCEAALLFSTGYMANSGVMSALVGRGDAIFADRLNHASLIDGAQLTRAEFKRYPHKDLAALERLLATSGAARKLIVTDSVFSMDGDIAPLAELACLAERFDAWLVIDDAHGLGIIGPQGRGALAHFGLSAERIVYIGTLGKAAGVAGAFAAGSRRVIEWLLQKTRTYIFTTAMPPLLAEALLTAVDLMQNGDARRATLQSHIAQLKAGLAGCALLDSPTPIQPLLVGGNEKALRLGQWLFDQGIWISPIRPPTVPEGSARLRICLSAAHSPEQVERLIGALRNALSL